MEWISPQALANLILIYLCLMTISKHVLPVKVATGVIFSERKDKVKVKVKVRFMVLLHCWRVARQLCSHDLTIPEPPLVGGLTRRLITRWQCELSSLA